MSGETLPPPPPAAPAPKRQILIVEDNEAAGIGLAQLLRNQGFEVTNVCDGAAAIEILASGIRFDDLLIDLRLPDFDGRELALQARRLSPSSQVLLMTGWDFDSCTDDPWKWGIERVIAKPIEINVLLDVLNGTGH